MSNRPVLSRMIIYLIRQGQSHDNARRQWSGRRDNSLTEFGKLQSEALANSLKLRRIDKIYSSTLLRARKTAEFIHAKHPTIPLIKAPLLIERDLGECEGCSFSKKILPEFRETCDQLSNRASRFWDTVKLEKGNLVIVSHRLFMSSFLHFLCEEYHVEKPRLFFSNTGWTSLSIEEGKMKFLEINQTGHLSDIQMRKRIPPRLGKPYKSVRG